MKKGMLYFGFLVALGACYQAGGERADYTPEDLETYGKDSANFYNYIIERDSLKALTQLDSTQSVKIAERIELLEKEIVFLRDKWMGKLK